MDFLISYSVSVQSILQILNMKKTFMKQSLQSPLGFIIWNRSLQIFLKIKALDSELDELFYSDMWNEQYESVWKCL